MASPFPLLLALAALSQAAPEQVSGPEQALQSSGQAAVPVWPVYLGASLGSFINVHGGVAAVRVSVEPSIFRRPLNEFTVVVELGAGVGYLMNEGLYTEHYNYSAIAGFAYRSEHRVWEWGFRIGLGVDWYRSTMDPSQPYQRFQQSLTGYIEGRGQLGLVFGPHLRAGIFVGYGSPFTYAQQFPGSWLVGGVHTGLYVSYR